MSLLVALPEVSVVVSRRIELSASAAAPIVASLRAAAASQGLSTVRRDDQTVCDGASACIADVGAKAGWPFVIHLDLASVGTRLLFRAELVRTRDGARLASEVAAVTGSEVLPEPISRFVGACVTALGEMEPVKAPVTETAAIIVTTPAAPVSTRPTWPSWVSFAGAALGTAAGLTFVGLRLDAGNRLDQAYQTVGAERRASLSFSEASTLASGGNVALGAAVGAFAVSVGLAVLGFVLLPPGNP
jgi:hypothetical protein